MMPLRCSWRMGRNVTSTPIAFPIWHTLVADLTLVPAWVLLQSKKSIMLLGLALGLWERGREVSCFLFVLETGGFVRPIAKWLSGGVAAAAKHDRLAASESVGFPLHIH